MCQASSSSVSHFSSSKSAAPAVSLRKPVTPSATFRLSMRRDRDSHPLPSSVHRKLSLLRRRRNHSAAQHDCQDLQQPTRRAVVNADEEPPKKESETPTTPTAAAAASAAAVVASVLLTPRTPDLLASASFDQGASLRWLSPPLLAPSPDEDEYRSISSLPDAILIPDF